MIKRGRDYELYVPECEHLGLDPTAVDKLLRRLARVAADADALGLTIFSGWHGSLRAGDDRCGDLVLGVISRGRWDGGDGAFCEAADGLRRGEVCHTQRAGT